MTYHNTIPLEGHKLVKAQAKAETQKLTIKNFFQQNPGRWTPFEVHRILKLSCPITSVRRAISDLTKDGVLIKTDYKKPEQYGTPNNTWTLSDRQCCLF